MTDIQQAAVKQAREFVIEHFIRLPAESVRAGLYDDHPAVEVAVAALLAVPNREIRQHSGITNDDGRLRQDVERLRDQAKRDVAAMLEMKARNHLTADWGECALLITHRFLDALDQALDADIATPNPHAELVEASRAVVEATEQLPDGTWVITGDGEILIGNLASALPTPLTNPSDAQP